MAQNLVSMVITQEQQDAALAGIAQAEAALDGLISLDPSLRKRLRYMGPKSVDFARGTVRLLAANTRIVPPSLDVAGAEEDLAAFDKLVPVLEALQRLFSRTDDTVLALGSDVMDFAYSGYGQLKLTGDAHGLEDLRKQLGARFSRGPRRPHGGA